MMMSSVCGLMSPLLKLDEGVKFRSAARGRFLGTVTMTPLCRAEACLKTWGMHGRTDA